MTRTLGVGIASEIAVASSERCQLIKLDFADLSNNPTPVYLTTAAKDIVWNSITWLATGHTLDIDAMGESADDPGNGIRVKLSGVDQTVLSLIMGNAHYRGRLATIYHAALDQSTGTVKVDPVIMFQGPMNGGFQIGESRGDFGGGTVDITGSFTSRLDELVKVRGIRCNVASHQSMLSTASTDTFFQNVDSLAQRKVFWGVKTPKEPYHGGGTQGGLGPNGGKVNPGPHSGTVGGTTPGGSGGITPPPPSNPGSIGGSTPGGSGGAGTGLTNPGVKPSIGWGST